MDVHDDSIIYIFLLFLSSLTYCKAYAYDPPLSLVPNMTSLFRPLSFEEGYTVVFGGPDHVKVLNGGYEVQLILDKTEGSGFVSQDDYFYGFFSASIKLPPQYSAGIVVAFYLSNSDVFPYSHDELDFEFLGHIHGKNWVLQTNVYGNGSVHTGREEKFHLWFDPTTEFHDYSIIWNHNHTVFLVDNIPIREMLRTEEIGGQYPLKPMSVYSTIWDGSAWATQGGKFPVDYNYAPFVSNFVGLELEGCVWNPTQTLPMCQSSPKDNATDPIGGFPFLGLTPEQRQGLEYIRSQYMFYSYCSDISRYPTPLPDCPQSNPTFSHYSSTMDVISDEDSVEDSDFYHPQTDRHTRFFKSSSMPTSSRVATNKHSHLNPDREHSTISGL